MAFTKVLITVTTYPLPSRSYDELVCTAGILENGQWIRIYPVPLKFLKGLRKNGKIETFKYNWLELDLIKRQDDFRPESHSPLDYSFSNVNILGKIDTKNNWQERKLYCLNNVYTNKAKLLSDSKNPTNVSLATFKPSRILSFEIEDDEREWRNEWIEIRKQGDLFDSDKSPEIQIPKLPYKFSYKFLDDEGVPSTLMIEDWEIGALYWNCLRAAEGNEVIALQKVREKYESEFLKGKDIHLFPGNNKRMAHAQSKQSFCYHWCILSKTRDSNILILRDFVFLMALTINLLNQLYNQKNQYLRSRILLRISPLTLPDFPNCNNRK